MSFTHHPITALTDYADNQRTALEAQIQTLSDTVQEQYAKLPRIAGFVVNPQLASLCEAVTKVYPQIQFLPSRQCKRAYVGDAVVLSEIWAFMPGDVYAPIRIGYHCYGVRTYEYQFSVYSRSINNQKYREDRDHRHMTLSDKLETAVRSVKKHYRPYQPIEVAGLTIGNLQSHIGSIRWEANSTLDDLRRKISRSDAMLAEFQRIITSGYEFIDKEFGKLVTDFIAANDDAKSKNGVAYHAYHVAVHIKDGVQTFDVTKVNDVQRQVKHVINGDVRRGCTADELPEDVPERLAALSMLENNVFMDGLGMKVNDLVYWVLV